MAKRGTWIGPGIAPTILPTPGINVQFIVYLDWRGESWYQRMLQNVSQAVTEVTEDYAKEIRSELFRIVGSRKIRGNLRKREVHSPPGSPPYWQTGNLRNSIKTSYNFRFRTSKGLSVLKSRISSDVKYAKQLERGGQTTTERKKHTHIRLVNPLKRNPIIHARPVWIPTFRKLGAGMYRKIRNAAANTP